MPAEQKEIRVDEQQDGSVVVSGFEEEQQQQNEAAAGAGTQNEGGEGNEGEQQQQPAGEHDDLDDDDDARITDAATAEREEAAAKTDEEREALRQRRREERAAKKERAKRREEGFQLQLMARDQLINELKERLDAVDRRNSGSELAQIESRLQAEVNAINQLKTVIADATKVSNGEAVAEATVALQQALINKQTLERIRTQHQRSSGATTPPQVDPRMVANATAWMAENPWYSPAKGDADSQQVLVIDRRLAEEGFDPTTPKYWEELSRRVREALPNRGRSAARQSGAPQPNGSGYNPPASQGKPGRSVVAGSGQGASSAAPKGYTLSAERVKALKDAGMWNDPKARDDAIKRFREYDAEASRSK